MFSVFLHDVAAFGSVLPERRGGFEGHRAGADRQQGLMGYALEGTTRGAAFEAGAPNGGKSGDVKYVSHAVYAHA